jgi:hypothetical protein
MGKPEDTREAAGVTDAAPQARTAPADPGDEGLNRRRNPRHRTLRSARIVFDGGRCSMACHVLDASETGALVMPADILLCPDHFVLRPLVGPQRACEVVWRKGTRVGVRYL